MRAIVLLTLVLAVAGCPTGVPDPGVPPPVPDPADAPVVEPEDGIVLTTDRESYAAGDEVRLALRNETTYEIGHNLCMDANLERREDAEWVAAELERDPCPALLALMPPGETATEVFPLGPGLPAGEYRFRVQLEHMDSGERRWHTSNEFSVTR